MVRLLRTATTLIAILTITTACSKPTPPPDCETFPGMPDRPCDPANTERSDYRGDLPEALGTTSRPQLLVFHLSILPDGTTGIGCVACSKMRPTVQQLEAEYWKRIDFVYLERSNAAVKPLLSQFGIAGTNENIKLNLILVDAGGKEMIRFYEGANQNLFGSEAPDIDFYRTVLDRQLEKLAAG